MNIVNILYTAILYPITQIIEIAFLVFNKVFDNTGISIIGVSLTVTLLCLPLYIIAEHWQQVERDTQTQLKPGIQRIKQAFKGDEQYMILSTFYKQNHYHPLYALRSSFGLLIQIPFFMAAYSCLSTLPSLQGQSFFFIRDLGVQDAVFSIGSFPINILPILMTLINIIAGAIYTKGFAIKEKLQIYGMALIFLVILYGSPSGLVLYWTMNNVFSLVKNIFYKLKNPLKVLYYCFVACVVGAVAFILITKGNNKKYVLVAIALLFTIPLPLYIKFINFVIDKPLAILKNDKSLRTKLFIFSSVSLCILCGVVLPGNLISSSVQEFSDIGKIGSPNFFLNYNFWHCFGIIFLWPACIYFLFHERIQTLVAFLFSLLLFVGIVDAFCFAGNYGSMDITLKFIGGIQKQSSLFILLNLFCVLCVITVLVIIIKFKKVKILNTIMLISIFVFAILSIINVSKISSEYKNFTIAKQSSSQQDQSFSKQIHLSKNGKNVIIFMLDRAESSYFEHIINYYPKIKTGLNDFTFYKNTVAFNGHTLMGSPAIYGGYDYTPSAMNKRDDVKLSTKHNEALTVLARVMNEQADFNSTLCDLSWGNYSYISDMSFANELPNTKGLILNGRYTGEFKKTLGDKNFTDLEKGVKRNLFWTSLFMSSPAIMRPIVYYKNGSYWASEDVSDVDSFLSWYSALYYLPQITSFENNNNSLVIMANEGTHSNEDTSLLQLVPEINQPIEESPGFKINVASLQEVVKFLDYLKQNNCYDNSRVIIIADHGIGYGKTCTENYTTPNLPNGFAKDSLNPLFLVKDFNQKGELNTDMTFMTTADVPSLALKDVVQNPTNPYTNERINMEAKKDGVLITTDDIFMPYHSKSEYKFTVKDDSWYTVKDNIFIDENWSRAK